MGVVYHHAKDYQDKELHNCLVVVLEEIPEPTMLVLFVVVGIVVVASLG